MASEGYGSPQEEGGRSIPIPGCGSAQGIEISCRKGGGGGGAGGAGRGCFLLFSELAQYRGNANT